MVSFSKGFGYEMVQVALAHIFPANALLFSFLFFHLTSLGADCKYDYDWLIDWFDLIFTFVCYNLLNQLAESGVDFRLVKESNFSRRFFAPRLRQIDFLVYRKYPWMYVHGDVPKQMRLKLDTLFCYPRAKLRDIKKQMAGTLSLSSVLSSLQYCYLLFLLDLRHRTISFVHYINAFCPIFYTPHCYFVFIAVALSFHCHVKTYFEDCWMYTAVNSAVNCYPYDLYTCNVPEY